MRLFNDTDIFFQGKHGKTIFDLPDTDLVLVDGFIPKELSDHYYNVLLAETQWREYEMPMYDKTVKAPRMIAWHEDKENAGADPDTPELSAELTAIREKVEAETEVKYNSVLLNLYRNGTDSVAWHSDKNTSSGKETIIASVTFGETRMFRLRHKFRKDLPQVEIPLYHGSLLLMAGDTQTFWEHQVPKTTKPVLPRINLTFRRILRQDAASLKNSP